MPGPCGLLDQTDQILFSKSQHPDVSDWCTYGQAIEVPNVDINGERNGNLAVDATNGFPLDLTWECPAVA